MQYVSSCALCALLLSACGEPAREPPPVPLSSDAGATGDSFGQDAANSEDDQAMDAGAGDATLEFDAGSALALDASSPLTLDAAADSAQTPPMIDAAAASEPARSSLAVPNRWQLLDAGADPFRDRPAMVDCLSGAVVAEDLAGEYVLGVETGYCGYLTALQPTQRAVAAGEVLKVRLWHFELSAPEPAEAHALVQIDGLVVLDERIPIPSPGGLTVQKLRVDRAIAAGAPAYFHLHNHGANSWALVELSAGPD